VPDEKEIKQKIIDGEAKVEKERQGKEKPIGAGQMITGDPPTKAMAQRGKVGSAMRSGSGDQIA
jgi:hypothetical protein